MEGLDPQKTVTQQGKCAGVNPIEKPIGKEHAEWDFAPYMDILKVVSSQRK